MRVGLTASIIGHAVLIGLGFVAFPEMRPFQTDKIEALPVELVAVSDETSLPPGDTKSKELPQEKPQPKPDVKAEAPVPKPTPEPPAKKPPETATAPPPPPPPPEPEPAPAPAPVPEPDLVAQPQEEVPAEKAPEAAPLPPPTTRVVTNPRVPRERPKPPKPQQVAKVEPKKKDDFNPDEIAALLNKAKPSGGDVTPAEEPQTIGSIDGKPAATLTQSELAALKARLYQCWNPPVAVREAGSLVVEVRINLLQDGSLAGPPELVRVEQVRNPLAQVAAEAAIRAVSVCAPFGDILRPENYAIWKAIDFVFDPREMLGGQG